MDSRVVSLTYEEVLEIASETASIVTCFVSIQSD